MRTLSIWIALVLCPPVLLAQDWPNAGGNAARNAFAYPLGPTAATALWNQTGDPSIIAWQPLVHAGRVFTIRESGFPQNGGAAGDALIAYDLDSGAESWRVTLPFGGNTANEWIAWLAGARDGRVYASRSSNGVPAPVRAYDAATGAPLWTSQVSTQAFAYDGSVFAPDGDLIVGDFNSITRIDAVDGHTVWSTPRLCPVSGNCGAAATATALYIDQAVVGGQAVQKLDLATGAVLYTSPTMPGFTDQNTPFVSHDGKTVYFSRTQNNVNVDELYAFSDDDTAFTLLWSRPIRWTTSHEHGLSSDGSIYTFLPNDEFVRLDPATGNVLNSAGVLAPLGSPNLSPRTVVDAAGTVYVSNGWASTPASNGRLWAFSADLAQTYFVQTLSRPNQGGPALAENGTLVMCDLAGVRAWRAARGPQTYCAPKVHSNGCGVAISPTGTPSASAGSGFLVRAALAPPAVVGILIYSTAGSANTPFLGGTLCLAPPVRRTGTQNSGPAGPCGGSFAFDFNALAASGADAALVAGAGVWSQYWFRDPPGTFSVGLSNALVFFLGP